MFNPVEELKGFKHDREYLKDILEYGGKPPPLYIRKYKALIKSGKKSKAEELKRKQYIAIVKHNIKRAQKPRKDKGREASRKHFLKEMEAELKSLETGEPRGGKTSKREVSMFHATGDWVDKYKKGDTLILKANKSKGPWSPLDKKAVYFSSNIEPNYAEGIIKTGDVYDEKKKLGVIKMKAKDRFRYNSIGEYEAAAKHDIKLKVERKKTGAHKFNIGGKMVDKEMILLETKPIGKVSFFSRAKKRLFSRSKKYYQRNSLKPGFIESSYGGLHSVFTLGKNSYNFGADGGSIQENDAEIGRYDKGDTRRQENIFYRKPLLRDIHKEPEYESVKKLKRENPELFWKIRKGEYTPSVNHVGEILGEEFNLKKRKYQSDVLTPHYKQQGTNCTNIACATADLFGFYGGTGDGTSLTDYNYDTKITWPVKRDRIVGDSKGQLSYGMTTYEGKPILMPKGEYKILVPNTEGQVEDNIRDSYKTFGFARKKKVSVKPHKRQLGKKTVKVKGYKRIVHTKRKVKSK
jgi:hypothetical protein